MANTKVTGDVIANGTISTVHIADDAITAAKLDSAATGITFADLTVDTDTLYVDSANNRVGIATTSPNEKLTVNGNIESLDTFILKNSGGHKWQQLFSTNDFVIRYNNTSSWYERMRIDSSGDLYIGGQTNYGKVTIEQGGDVSGLVINNTTAHRPRLYLRDAGGAGYSEILANNDLYLNASAVGIGTTSPGYKLEVAGTVGINSNLTMSTSAEIRSSDGTGIRLRNAANSANEGGFVRSGLWEGDSSRDPSLFAETGLGLRFYTGGSATERMVINSSGNVGINETAPAAKLQVSGDRDGVSEYVAILGEDGGANGAANSANTTPVHKTLLTGYSIPYSGQTNARLTSVGFLEFDSTPGWTGNQRNYALTSGYDMGGTGGPKFAILMGNTQNVEPQLGTNGAVGSGTGDGVNTRVCSYWDNGGNLVVPEGSITVNSGIYVGGSAAANNLDDYEEGTFTPTIGDGTYTYSYRRGHYQKIGNTVYIHIGFKINTASSVGTATATISGLPFTGMSWGSYQEPMEKVVGGLFVTSNLSSHLAFFVSNSSSTLYARTTASNSDTAVSSNQLWQNGTFMKIQLQYTVS